MWDRPNRRHFYARSYRSAPPKLIPAIIACQTSTCLIFFAIFLLIAGSVLTFVAGDDSPPPEGSPFNSPFFNEHRKEAAKTPRIIGTIILTIGGFLCVCFIISITIAFLFYRKYEKERKKQNQTPSQVLTNYEASAPPLVGGVDYPIQTGYQYNSGYQPVSQSVVYNPTTEPNPQLSQLM